MLRIIDELFNLRVLKPMLSTIQLVAGPATIASCLTSLLATIVGAIPAIAADTQEITIRFAAKVGNQAFACGLTYPLGQPATDQTLSDFRFYISDVELIDATGKAVPVVLVQDGRWQYQTVALLDLENKTGACSNGTIEMRDRIIGNVPKGQYTGLKFTLGVPFGLNHDDSALAPSPLNLTSLWWNWQLGYKFARIDLQPSITSRMMHDKQKQAGHDGFASTGSSFPIHLGSTGCQSSTISSKPSTCNNPNRATVLLTQFDPSKNVVVADLAQLVAATNLNQNQPKTTPGCMSQPNDQDCIGIMATLGLPFMGKPAAAQTFFRVE